MFISCLLTRLKGKGKVRPRTGNESPEEEYRYSSTLSLTSALDGGGWLTPCLGRFTPRERYPCAHCIGRRVGPTAGLVSLKTKTLSIVLKTARNTKTMVHNRESIPGPSSSQWFALPTELSRPTFHRNFTSKKLECLLPFIVEGAHKWRGHRYGVVTLSIRHCFVLSLELHSNETFQTRRKWVKYFIFWKGDKNTRTAECFPLLKAATLKTVSTSRKAGHRFD